MSGIWLRSNRSRIGDEVYRKAVLQLTHALWDKRIATNIFSPDNDIFGDDQ
jgi:hypothetical protein